MKIKEHIHLFFYKKKKKLSKTKQKGWQGLSILICSEDSHKEPHNFRINYFVLVFICFFLMIPPITSSILFFKEVKEQKILERTRLLNISMDLTIEKKKYIEKIQKQLNQISDQFYQKKGSILLKNIQKSIPKYIQIKTSQEKKPGEHRSEYELELLLSLKNKMKNIMDVQTPFIFGPIWNRIFIYHFTPRGWALLGGVGHVTSLYGYRKNPIGTGIEFHSGIDFAYAAGTPIIATAPGFVIRAVKDSNTGFGKFVRIHHGFGFTSLYAHCQELAVKEEDYVERGQVIGYIGHTGRATGDHLHYVVKIGHDQAIDPLPYVNLE